MKKVLLPMALNAEEEETKGQKNFVRTSYIKKLCKHGMMPCPLSPYVSPEIREAAYSEAAGVLLMGGLDVNPSRYGQECHAETIIAPPVSESLEFDLVTRAINDKKPILGICRGIQVLNVALGGSLHQHIEDLDLSVSHGDTSEGQGYRYIGNCKHEIFIEAGTRFFDIFQKKELTVNSGHHQALDLIATDLTIAARAACGTVEAVEHNDKDYFCFAVQSHPEFLEEGAMEELFAAFSEALG